MSNQYPRDHRLEPAGEAQQETGEPVPTSRRTALKWLIRVSYGAFGLAFAVPALALRTLTQKVEAVTSGDRLVVASGNQAGAPLNANDMAPGSGLQALPEGKADDSKNLVQVVKLSDAPDSVVAYSAICTHLGCSVLPTLNEEGHIFCPCHASVFDPSAEAAVLSGPAGRPLPSLPVTVEADGSIIVAGGFSDEVGPN